MILRNLPIRQKLSFVTMLTSISSLLLISLAFIIIDINDFHNNTEAKLQSIAKVTAFNSTAAISFDDKEASTENLNSMNKISNIYYAVIIKSDGSLFSQYHGEHSDAINHSAYLSSLVDTLPDCNQSSLKINQLTVCETITLNGEDIGRLYIVARLSDLYIELGYRLITTLIILLITILIAYLLSRRFGNIISEPIISLSNTITEVTNNKDYSTRAKYNENDEVGLLAKGFNDMLQQIQYRNKALRLHQDKLEDEITLRTGELFSTVTQLKEAKALAEKANNAKSQFLSQMSHELRTPMNAILGYAQLLRLETSAPLSANQLDHVNEIINAGDHLLELINKVLDLSHVESGTLEVSIENINLQYCVEECITLIGPLAIEKNIAVINNLDSDIYVLADYTHIKQVIINLLSNGIKYNKIGGTLTIDDCSQHKNKVCFSIRDTGHGLSDSQLSRLFKPFDRLGAENTSVQGTGIGLLICKQLIEIMKGKISVSSVIDEGTTFAITLDAASTADSLSLPNTMADNPLAISHPDHKGCVLYIEDNPANLKLVKAIITDHMHMEFLGAGDAHIGIQMAIEFKPDLILMDINLPGMDGFTALKELKRTTETASIPVIALSASAMPRDISRGKTAGFKNYLTKPIKLEELSLTIIAALGPNTAN